MRWIVLALLLLTACVPGPPEAARSEEAALDPIAFFTGATRGRGMIDPIIGSDRALGVKSHGRIRGNSLVVDQRISVEGEHPRRRRWTLRRLGPGRFAASLTDADGPVSVKPVGRAIKIRYEATNGGQVEQWLVARPDGCSLDNRLSVIRVGIELAHVTEVITKPAPCAPREPR